MTTTSPTIRADRRPLPRRTLLGLAPLATLGLGLAACTDNPAASEDADGGDSRGGLTTPIPLPPAREVYLLQRTKGAQGRGLGKTSGWVHRASVKAKGVQQLSGVNYEKIDDAGLHISFGSDRSGARVLEVDNVVICAGQESVRDLEDGLRQAGIEPHIIGGAAVAAELDAKRAIRQGTELAAKL